MRATILIASLSLLVACASEGEDTAGVEPPTHADEHLHEEAVSQPASPEIPLETALQQALASGVPEGAVLYAGLIPYVISEEEAVPTWGVISDDGEGLRVSWFDQETGEPIEVLAEAPPNIVEFVQQTGLDLAPTFGSTAGTYDSFPWGWRLPMESGTFTLTCGYGCYAHTGSIYYSTDWANGSSGHLLESAASGWVMYRSTSSGGGYGYQLIVEGGSAGSGKEYYYRIAHLRDRALVSPGTWIGKGRNVGYIGSTGNSTGPHVHYEVIRASSTSGGSFSGADDLPINLWPTSRDSICNGAFTSRNFSGSTGYRVTVQSNGCP